MSKVLMRFYVVVNTILICHIFFGCGLFQSTFKGQVPDGNISVVIKLPLELENDSDTRTTKDALVKLLSNSSDKIQVIDPLTQENTKQLYPGIIVTLIQIGEYEPEKSINSFFGDINPRYGYQVLSPFHPKENIFFDNLDELLHFLRLK